MKKSIKIISLFIISLIMIFVGKETVFAADSVPTTFTAVSSKMTTSPIGLESNNISVKKTKDGKYIYCYDVNDKVPNNITYTKKEAITDPIVNYIIAQGLTQDDDDNEFFSTQSALWIYLLDNGKMKDTEYGYINKIKTAMKNNPTNYVYARISKILEDAIKYSEITMADVEIKSSNISFDLKDGYYVSNTIKVNKAKANYEVTLKNAPKGTKVEKNSDGFVVTVPEASVSEGTTKFTVNVTGNKYVAYRYVASDSSYQDMLAAYAINTSDSVDLSITKTVTPEPEPEPTLDPTTIVISKKDITTGEELPGATLVIKNAKGEVIETWVSTNETKKIKTLEVGKYTLEETIAPEGYQLSTEVIEFEVKEDGKIETVVMYNTPEKVEETVVKISKIDITTGKELAGATLVVRNSEGEIIETWVSTNEAYIIKGLEEGTYTLEETIAPEGYKLSTEKITFEVKNNGVVTEVVMNNTPESTEIIEVPATGSFASSVPYIIGGLVIIIGSVLVYRNAKKEQ